ncbi:alcohol dehydrogenase catalytic domain-containing protein [Nocardia sp. NPDC004722]
MRSLWYTAPGVVQWREVPAPRLDADTAALVEPVAASRCAYDRLLISGDTPIRPGFAIGHEAVCRVRDIGDAVTRVRVGDLVVVCPFVACGTCGPCRAGRNSHCSTTPQGASFGVPAGGSWGGLYDDVVRVPYADAMLTPLPAGVNPAEFAPVGDSLTLGYEVMSQRLREGHSRILVLGWSEHGLYQVAFAAHLGATEIVYVDENPRHREIATALGARSEPGPPGPQLGRFDLIIGAHPDPGQLTGAFYLLEEEGVIDSLGGFANITVPQALAYSLGATLRVFRGYSNPDTVATAVRAILDGHIQPSIAYSHIVDWDDIPTAMSAPDGKPVAIRTPE